MPIRQHGCLHFQKEADKLNISKSELTVLAVEDEKEYECVLNIIETSNATDSIDCDILNKPNAKINLIRVKQTPLPVQRCPDVT